jgi:hypothetical protein
MWGTRLVGVACCALGAGCSNSTGSGAGASPGADASGVDAMNAPGADGASSGGGAPDATVRSTGDGGPHDAGALNPSDAPIVVGNDCVPSVCAPTAIATGQVTPLGVAADSKHVYWTIEYASTGSDQDSGVFVVLPTGSDAGISIATGLPDPANIALDNVGNAYFGCACNFEGVRKIALDSGAVTILTPQRYVSQFVAVARGAVYYYFSDVLGDGGAAGLWTVSTSGEGAPTLVVPVAPGGDILGMTADENNVYWCMGVSSTATGTILKMPLGGSDAVPLTSSSGALPLGIAVDATNVYWTSQNLAADGGVGNGAIMKMAIDGHSPAVALATTAGLVGAAIAVDTDNVYWIERQTATEGDVRRVPIGGGAPVTLAHDETFYAFQLAVDATNVYWPSGDMNGSVNQVAKCCTPPAGGDQ